MSTTLTTRRGRLAIVIFGAMALTGCGDPVRTLAESPSAEKRSRAAREIGEQRNPSHTRHLVAALEDPDEPVRETVAWALGQIATAEAIEALSRALGDPSELVRSEAALGLGRGGAAVAGRLVQALADPEAIVRASAAKALGDVGGPVASLGLRQAVVDPYPRVRAAAVGALSKAEGEGATAEIQAALSDDYAGVRLAAAKALASRPDSSAAFALTKALEDRDGEVARFAARALVRIPTHAAVAGLASVAQSFEGEFRDDAFRALAGLGVSGGGKSPSASTVLVLFLRHAEPEIRALAARSLGSMMLPKERVPDSKSVADTVIEELVKVLSDPVDEVCREAAYSLAVYRRPEGVALLVEDLVAGPRRAKAIDALAAIGPPAEEAVRGLVADRKAGREAITAAMIVLAEIGSRESAAAIARELDSPHAETRAVAALAVGQIGAAEPLGRIRALAYDRDARVRMAAAYASAKLGDDSRLDELGLALRQGGEPTRWMAAELLTELLDDRLAAARAGGSDVAAAADPVARRLLPGLEAPQGAVRALSARGLGREGFADAATVAALGALASDLDARVRVAASRALGRIGTPESLKALGPLIRDSDSKVRLAAAEALAVVPLSAEPSGTPSDPTSDPTAREGVRLAASALVDPRREVRKAALGALAGLSGQSFGLKPGRAPSDDELESAIRRAQIWWNEHEREYRPAEPPRTPPAP